MRLALLSVLGAIALAMFACASSGLTSAAGAANEKLAAQGLPFRWSVQGTGDGDVMVMRMLPLPVAPTRADAHLTQEILVAIGRREQSKGRVGAELQEVRQMADGREVWILQSLVEGIAYVVSLGDSTQGANAVRVKGPYSYSK